MISVNIHEAKSNLSKLLEKVENLHEIIQICRNGKPVAKITPIDTVVDPLQLHSELQGVAFNYDPIEPLTEDEWPNQT